MAESGSGGRRSGAAGGSSSAGPSAAGRGGRSDARRHARYRGVITVKVGGDGTQRYGTVYDISAGGAFLAVSPLPAVGAEILVTIVVAGAGHAVPASVRHRVGSQVGPGGMEGVGVQWGELLPPARALVDVLVSRAAAGKPLRSGA